MTAIGDLSYAHQQAIEAMKSQLLIVLVNRLGGSVDIPASEIDGTGRFNMLMKADPETRTFTFTVEEKQKGPA